MLIWLFLATPLLLAIDLETMTLDQAMAALRKQGFTHTRRPDPTTKTTNTKSTQEDPLKALERALDQLQEASEWVGVNEGQIRMSPVSAATDVMHVTLGSCPATGKLATMTVQLKPNLRGERFNELMRQLSANLKQTPHVDGSKDRLTVEWLRPTGGRYALAQSSTAPPVPIRSITIYSDPATVRCEREFWLAQ